MYMVILQPDGKLGIWSTYADEWAAVDGSAEEVIEWFAQHAASEARRDMERLIGFIVAGDPRGAYPRALSFEECEERAERGRQAADVRREWEAAQDVPG